MIILDEYEKLLLCEENILRYTTDEAIFAHYLGDLKTNKAILSPLRKESNPSFVLFYSNKYNRIMFYDHATGDKGTFVNFISILYNVDRQTALAIVAKDLGIDKYFSIDEIYPKGRVLAPKIGKSIDISSDEKSVKIKARNWQICDAKYWSQYGIHKSTLITYRVCPVKYIFIGNHTVIAADELAYAYRECKDNEVRYKIYQPYNKTFKWHSDFLPNTLSGYAQLPPVGKLLFITSSLKDLMCLYELGYAAVSPQSENHEFKDSLIEEFKSRFDKIVIFYDSDEPGRKFSAKLSEEYNLPRIDTDSKYKDISDYIKYKGIEEANRLIITQLKKI